MLRRRKDDTAEWAALLRVSQHDGKPLYEGEISPGHQVDLPDGWRIEVLWIRKHATPAARS